MQLLHEAEGTDQLTVRPLRSPRPLATALVLALALGLTPAVGAPAGAGGGDPASGDEQQVAVVTEDGVEPREVDDDELAELQAGPGVVVTRGRVASPELDQSVPKVGAPSLWNLGHRGDGRVIVVIDTGVGTGFGGSMIGQACFAATQEGEALVGHCGPDGTATQAFDSTCFDLALCDGGDVLDPDAARPCTEPALPKDCAHGSAVAAVAARHDAPPGVAPDADVYAIQVFEPTGRSADFVDILLALDHAVDLADAGMDIAAVNLSLSSAATYPTACDLGPNAEGDGVAFRAAFQQLAGRGIPSTVATGNDAQVGGIGLPACVSNAIAVGASDLDDQIADFGNRGPTVDLVAPGADEGNGAIDRMEIPGSPVTQWAGTSFAAPHVAGAFALLQQEYPYASVAMVLAHLRTVAARAVDPETGTAYKRLRLLPPAQGLPAGLFFPATAAIGAGRGAVGDFDGDGFDDVLSHGPDGAPDAVAYGRASWTPAKHPYTVNGSYVPLVGNFRGSAVDDILWYRPGSASDWLWVGSPTRAFGSAGLTINGTYKPLVGDYDGDGFDDILWYAPGRAFDALWYGGPTGFTSRAASINGGFRGVAVGDVNGDGRDDVVFHGVGAASDWLWRGTASKGTWLSSPLTIGGTKVLRTGDFDGDLDDDLLLYEGGSAADSIWRGGPAVGGPGATGGFSPMAITVNGQYHPVVGDVDGDARDDIVWYAPGSAGEFLWLGRAVGLPASRSFSVLGLYAPLIADLDGDAGGDVVWFSGSSTSTVYWSHPG